MNVLQWPARTKRCACCGGAVFGHSKGRVRCKVCYICSCSPDGDRPRKGCPRHELEAAAQREKGGEYCDEDGVELAGSRAPFCSEVCQAKDLERQRADDDALAAALLETE